MVEQGVNPEALAVSSLLIPSIYSGFQQLRIRVLFPFSSPQLRKARISVEET